MSHRHHRVTNVKNYDLFDSVWSLQPVFNLMIDVHVMVILATQTFREKKKQQQSRFFSFLLNFNVYADVDNRERARVTNKQVLLETQHENFKEVVRNVSGQ